VRIEHLLPGRAGHVGGTAGDNRLFVEAVLYRYRTGVPWRDLPERFGDWKNVHRRFSRWAASGVWARAFGALSADADDEYALLDATIVRAHQHSAGARKGGGGDGEALGRSRGGLSTKRHAVVDARGNPTGFHLTGGEAHDLAGADALLPDLAATTVIADRGYDAETRVLAVLRKAGKVAVIPPKRRRTVQRDDDRHLYGLRYLVEHFFNRLKQYRAIATRYDKTKRNFLAAIHLVASAILLN